jgi:hypothetical protein
MLSGKKSDLKNHLSTKHPTWSHKIMVHGAHEQNSEMGRHDESPPERVPPKIERLEPIQPRY